MPLPEFSMRQLLDAGMHFGHHAKRWNPKMAPYIYGSRNDIHIIDLTQTVPLLHQALVAVRDAISGGGQVWFVCTRKSARDAVSMAARRCFQPYVVERWTPGLLTNWPQTVRDIEKTSREIVSTGQKPPRNRSLEGFLGTPVLPSLLFILDCERDAIAVTEAKRLGIPIVGVLDSNSDPDGIAYPIPANNDAPQSIELICTLISKAILAGYEQIGAFTTTRLFYTADKVANQPELLNALIGFMRALGYEEADVVESANIVGDSRNEEDYLTIAGENGL
jgi:small subunit ribosomal protein S2